MRIWITALALLLWALPIAAHETVDVRNRISFSVQATREVPNDWVTARMSVVAEGKDPAVVANDVNQQMASALAKARKAKQVEVESGAYVTQPVYDSGRVVRWRAQQELRLEAADVDRLSKLIGTLQSERVQLTSIDFSVKRETREELEAALIEEALSAFRARAGRVAQGMGASDWSLIQLSVGNAGGAPRMVRMHAEADMMSKSMAAPPVFEAGTSDLRIGVDGTIELE